MRGFNITFNRKMFTGAKIIAVFFVFLFSVGLVSSLTVVEIRVESYGTISNSIYALSGSAIDIQTAVNIISAKGGGTVYIPAGTFTFNINQSNIGLPSYPIGVQIPGGVNVIGAGSNSTILSCPLTGWKSSGGTPGTVYLNTMFIGDGTNNQPIRISGITFIGSVDQSSGADDNFHALSGIRLYGVKDFRIDHCKFLDFTQCAIGTDNNYVGNPTGNCGVIDHCIIDNPYKDTFYTNTGNQPFWAYGIQVGGPYGYNSWDPDWTHFFGQYRHDITYIEDCTISSCRHAIAGEPQSYGFYVLRHCTMTDMIVAGYGSYQDVHGGGEGCECYDNTIINTPVDYRSAHNHWGEYQGIGFYPRGGFGLFYNNTIQNFQDSGSAITLANDQSSWGYARLNGVWIWDNNYVNCPTQLTLMPGAFTITQNVEYFLRSPNQAQDGFTYIPYPYPHPLTI
jgi:hypothetical protein